MLRKLGGRVFLSKKCRIATTVAQKNGEEGAGVWGAGDRPGRRPAGRLSPGWRSGEAVADSGYEGLVGLGAYGEQQDIEGQRADPGAIRLGARYRALGGDQVGAALELRVAFDQGMSLRLRTRLTVCNLNCEEGSPKP